MGHSSSEREIKKAIKDLLDACGIFHYPITQGLGSFPGLPDRQAFWKGQTWHIEIKTPRGRLSPHQIKFQVLCEQEGIPYIVVRSPEELAEKMGLPVSFGSKRNGSDNKR